MLANPPCIRQELIKDQKPALRRLFPAVFDGRADLYCYFYARALQLLCANGMLAFISSNRWFRGNYGRGLRQTVAETCNVRSITDFGELPVFQEASTFPMIFVAQKGKATADSVFTQVVSLDPPYPDASEIVRSHSYRLPAGALSGSNWRLSNQASSQLVDKMEEAGPALASHTPVTIYSGIKSGYNAAFIIDAMTRSQLIAESATSRSAIKNFCRGDDVRKWHIRDRDEYIIYTPPGIDINKYPAIKRHLAAHRERLEARAIKQPWWELQQAQNRDGVWKGTKVIFPDIAKESRFTLDATGIYADMTAFVLPVADVFLVAVLNSAIAWTYLCQVAAILGDAARGGRIRLKRQYVQRLPIPSASEADRSAIAALAQKCLNAKGVGCEAWEKEIDERVAALYGL